MKHASGLPKRTIVFVSIGLLIISIVLSLFWQKKQKRSIENLLHPAPTEAQTKTYTNTLLGYSFTYKGTLTIEDATTRAEATPSASTIILREHGGVGSIWIDIQEFSKPINNLEAWVNETYGITGGIIEPRHIPYNVMSDIRYKVERLETLQVDGKEAVRLVASVNDTQATHEMDINSAFIRLSPTTLLSIAGDPGIQTIEDGRVDKLLSTLQFSH